MAYRNQPNFFRNGANSAFHEGNIMIYLKKIQNWIPRLIYLTYDFKAIGDTIAMSVVTKKHLKQINLIESDEMTPGNFLVRINSIIVFG